jgi:indolepyruvate ferredoxin oxidoreductase
MNVGTGVDTHEPVSLQDKYDLDPGRVLITGTQALVRILLLQRKLDSAAGLNTAGYATGYRGSPLGAVDMELWAQATRLSAAGIIFKPGVNEDLAATAVWGTQQASLFPGSTHDGVFALWYAKGPGVDRSGDALKHGNRQGASRHGGVMICVGDDHPGKSSTVAHHSEQALAASQIPVLYPSSVQEIIEFGLLGWAMSRFSGLWVGLKLVNETAEGTATVDIDSSRYRYQMPDCAAPAIGRNLNPRPMVQREADEELVVRFRLPAALAFARANPVDRVVLDSARRRLGIVTSGKAYSETMLALDVLGIDAAKADALGIRLYKVGMIWPLEPTGIRCFGRGHEEMLFIEEKAASIESQAARVLYDLPVGERPRITGKHDETGGELVPEVRQLAQDEIALILGARLERLDIADAEIRSRLSALRSRRSAKAGLAGAPLGRVPYFCSGCPHNTSTQVPEGSVALAGIGCHTMAGFMDRRTMMPTQMGGEGLNWTGIAPFTSTRHVFQNLGDGTYFHSGLLAVRGAVAAGVNITYKILYNDAVAMTGGQPVEGQLAPTEIARQLLAERVRRVAIVTDEPARYRSATLRPPRGVTVHHRNELAVLQDEFRQIPGVTALIYEQTCAAENRRRRKRGEAPDPPVRMFINEEVCEGCGDCSVQSNCVSIVPKETALGRKREIDQSSCNKDLSCANGFCPSFVSVHGGQLRRRTRTQSALPHVPEPPPPSSDACNVLVAGIGGTGVVTIGAVLAMAAHLDGRRAAATDMTGLAQKNGAVWSHLRIGPASATQNPPNARLGSAETDALIACDIVAATDRDVLDTLDPERSQVIANTLLQPTAHFQANPDLRMDLQSFSQVLAAAVGPARVRGVRATQAAEELLGSGLGANFVMVGAALQAGALSLSVSAVERAIELNGQAVAMNRAALTIGRLAVHDPGALDTLLRVDQSGAGEAARLADLDDVMADRARRLTDYQDEAYARRYRTQLDAVRAVELERIGRTSLTDAIARNYYKLLAYKDEYEVARLHSGSRFREQLAATFEGSYTLHFHLAPSAFRSRRKREFGPWMATVLRLLSHGRRLRGTWLDPFRWQHERRIERQLITEYEQMIAEIAAGLTPSNHAAAIEWAAWPDAVRGFGHVKAQSLARAQAQAASARQAFRSSAAHAPNASP